METANDGVFTLPIMEVYPNPLGEKATPESMQQNLDEIKSIEHWSSTFGQRRGHGTIIIDAISRLVTEGAKNWRFDVSWNYIQDFFSNVTPAKWWIMIYSENRAGEQLYSKLAKRAKYFHPYVWTAKTCQTMAEGFLHSTAHQMSEEGVQDMCEQLAAFRTFSYGAGPIDG